MPGSLHAGGGQFFLATFQIEIILRNCSVYITNGFVDYHEMYWVTVISDSFIGRAFIASCLSLSGELNFRSEQL